MYNQTYHGGEWARGAWMGHVGVGAGAPDWALALFAFLGPLLVIIILWSLFWKGLALWHSARRGQYWWFAIMLVVNTAGILEIIYLFGIAKLKVSQLFSVHAPHEH